MQMWQLYLVYPFIMFYNFIFFPFPKVEIKYFEPDLTHKNVFNMQSVPARLLSLFIIHECSNS
jgi:hypothetical protein